MAVSNIALWGLLWIVMMTGVYLYLIFCMNMLQFDPFRFEFLFLLTLDLGILNLLKLFSCVYIVIINI